MAIIHLLSLGKSVRNMQQKGYLSWVKIMYQWSMKPLKRDGLTTLETKVRAQVDSAHLLMDEALLFFFLGMEE